MAEAGKGVESMFGQLKKLVGESVGEDLKGLDRDISAVSPGHGRNPNLNDFFHSVYAPDHWKRLRKILETDKKKYGKLLEKVKG